MPLCLLTESSCSLLKGRFHRAMARWSSCLFKVPELSMSMYLKALCMSLKRELTASETAPKSLGSSFA